MSKIKIAFCVISTFVLVLALDYFSIIWTGVTAPKREQIRREVFEQTKSYKEGKRQELMRYMLQYSQADSEGKKAIKSFVRMAYADVNQDEMSIEMKEFINK